MNTKISPCCFALFLEITQTAFIVFSNNDQTLFIGRGGKKTIRHSDDNQSFLDLLEWKSMYYFKNSEKVEENAHFFEKYEERGYWYFEMFWWYFKDVGEC